MRRGLLQDFANTVCDMATGYELSGDVELLNRVGRGRITIDLLTGAFTCDGAQLERLAIAGVLHDWFTERCVRDGVPPHTVGTATLVLTFESNAVSSQTFKLMVKVQSVITTADATTFSSTGSTGW